MSSRSFVSLNVSLDEQIQQRLCTEVPLPEIFLVPPGYDHWVKYINDYKPMLTLVILSTCLQFFLPDSPAGASIKLLPLSNNCYALY